MTPENCQVIDLKSHWEKVEGVHQEGGLDHPGAGYEARIGTIRVTSKLKDGEAACIKGQVGSWSVRKVQGDSTEVYKGCKVKRVSLSECTPAQQRLPVFPHRLPS